MSAKFTSLFTFFILAHLSLFSQTVKDKVVAITATFQTTPLAVNLQWENPSGNANILLLRREKDAATWNELLNLTQTNLTAYTDTNVETGKTWEYVVQRQTGNIYAYGYMTVPLAAPAVDYRGKMLVFVEEGIQQPLAMELERLAEDLVGDGWQVIWHPVVSTATVTSIKTQIVADYNADPANVKSVFLLGEIPVPYSGNSAWDGHSDHQGAWPADVYYGDMDGIWTDSNVANTTPARQENKNIPGDGKFDHSIAPSAAELAVGRVDFSNLSETTFGTTRVELYRRYLNKNHNWRTKQYTVANKALVDDNFGYFGGEAFAANGYRNAYPLVGVNNVMAGDFFNDTDSQSFLLGYGCGGGTYTSAGGVGNSTNFATDSVNIVFSMLFGSYHGDWDYSPNPFMPSALASKGGILSVSWAGRPHWFYHHLAAGETLGYCAVATQNACDNDGYFGSAGTCGAHVSLMGDPSLRAQVVAPVSALVAENDCGQVELSWKATGSVVSGYHVYRATAFNSEYVRLTSEPVVETAFTDDSPLADTLYYQVRAVVLENTPSGSYFNTSTGVFASVIVSPEVIADAGPEMELNCTVTAVILEGSASTAGANIAATWTTNDGLIVSGPLTVNPVVAGCGTYYLTVTDTGSGCTAIDSVAVVCDTSLPDIDITGNYQLVCGETVLEAVSSTPGVTFLWEGGGFNEPGNPVQTITVPGTYKVIAIGPNGCSEVVAATITAGAPPLMLEVVTSSVGCDGFADIAFFISGGTPPYVYQFTPDPPFPPGATYMVTVVDADGCPATFEGVNLAEPAQISISINHTNETIPGANDGSATAIVTGNNPAFTYKWSNGQTTQTISDLAPGAYTVTVTDAFGCSSTASVTILAAPLAAADVPGLKRLEINPNPSSGLFWLDLILEKPTLVSMEMQDATGRSILKTKQERVLEKQWEIDLSSYAAGVYVCKLWIDGQMVSRKVVKME